MTTGILEAIGATTALIKAAVEAVRVAKDAVKKNPAAQEALGLAQERILALQSQLLTVQEKALDLQARNAELTEQNRQYSVRALERDKYERKKIGKSHVYVPKGETEPYLCPTCFENSRFVHLSRLPSDFEEVGFGTHMCHTCDSRFDLKR